jgi:hypothetical protein
MQLGLPVVLVALALAVGCGGSYARPSYYDGHSTSGGVQTGTSTTVIPAVTTPVGQPSPVVTDALRGQDGRLQACWDRLALDHPELADGRAIVQFHLDPSGRVQSAELLSGPVEDPSFRTCVEERARGMSFPQGDAPSVFSHSFTFGMSAGTGVE